MMKVGKKNKLKQAVKECHKLNNDILNLKNEYFIVNDNNLFLKDSDSEIVFNKTISIFQSSLLDFADRDSYPLCEYLDLKSVKTFLTYILQK
jgi:hypothetical protein